MLLALILIPLIASLLTIFQNSRKRIDLINIISPILVLLLTIQAGLSVLDKKFIVDLNGFFRVDALSIFIMLIISIISLIVLWYSRFYIGSELNKGIIDLKKFKQYYALTQIFIFAMLFAMVSDHTAFIWMAIEATTLITAFLVSFYNTDKSIEAGWKYLILCTVGVTLAFFGILLFYFAAINTGAEKTSQMLFWSYLFQNAQNFSPAILKIAFAFIFIGLGTKAGLVPLHTWLPDAYSRTPAPISALMSAALSNVAIYAILRFKILTDLSLGTSNFTNNFFLIFGVMSVVVPSFLILASNRYKRLLAYSSIEQTGIIFLGFGLGSPLALFGTLWHIMNNALIKSFLFLTSGNILRKYRSGQINKITGLYKMIPITATLFIIGIIALAGLPPFGIFFSEFMILSSATSNFHFIAVVITIIALIIAFAGLFIHTNKMVFSAPTEGMKPTKENLNLMYPIIALLILMIISSFFMPQYILNLFDQIQQIFAYASK